jgi:tRNA U34 2-thiouridine synthase MnmA/TrmU
VDNGRVVGQHDGQECLTVGQKARIGGASDKYYIVEKISHINVSVSRDLHNGDVIVAKGFNHRCLFVNNVHIPLSSFNWISGKPPAALHQNAVVTLQYKNLHSPKKGNCQVEVVSKEGTNPVLRISFSPSRRILTPGQIFVLYDGEECLGGAPIPADRASFLDGVAIVPDKHAT